MVDGPTTEVTLERARLSFVWHQGLMAEDPLARPLVVDQGRHQEIFSSRSRGALSPPWPSDERQGFWERYLNRLQGLPEVTARNCWRALVPLRLQAPVALSVVDGTVVSEGFLHPWGSSFVLTIALAGPWTGFAALVERLLELRHQGTYAAAAGGGEIDLEEAARRGLGAVNAQAFQATPGPRTDAFSVFTLLAAAGPAQSFDPSPAGAEVARFIQATTTFSESWREDPPRTPAEATVAAKPSKSGAHIVWGSPRARAIWGPADLLATADSAAAPPLASHHRNLVLASMQTEALGRFVAATAARSAANIALADENRVQAKWAASQLQSLRGGAEETYRSGSTKAQIEQSGWLPAIAAVEAL